MSVQNEASNLRPHLLKDPLSSHACTQACVLRQGVNHSFMAHLLSLYLFYFLSFSHLFTPLPFFFPFSLAARLSSYFSWLSLFVTSTPLKRMHANVCTIFVLCAAPRSSSPGPTLFSASPLQFLDGYILVGESAHVLWAEHVLFSIVWRRCAYWMEWGKVKETIWLSYGPPSQTRFLW